MLLSPNEAPSVHIEVLPDTVFAAEVTTDGANYTVTMWADGPYMNSTLEQSEESFIDGTCYDCQYYTDTISVNVEGDELCDSEGNEVILRGDCEAYSPCSCYSDGLGSVHFPCLAGNDGPISDDDGPVLDTMWLRYSLSFGMHSKFHKFQALHDSIVQQGSYVDEVDNEFLVAEDIHTAINTYESDGSVCWGSNDTPETLLGIYNTYVNAPANEDLCSFEVHQEGTEECSDIENLERVPNAIIIDPKLKETRAIICASATANTSSFLMLSTSGATVDNHVAYLPVKLYRNVAIDDDTVTNVWASEVLSIGKRFLFVDLNSTRYDNALLIAQVPSDFNLLQCKSIQQQSSEQAELVSS